MMKFYRAKHYNLIQVRKGSDGLAVFAICLVGFLATQGSAATSTAARDATAQDTVAKAETNPHYGKYQASTPVNKDGFDVMTTVKPEGKKGDLVVEFAWAKPDRPADAGKVLWDGKKTNPTRFTGRTTGWGALYDVRGIYVAKALGGGGGGIGGGGADGDPEEWFSHFKPKNEPRIVLEINGGGNHDNSVLLGNNVKALTVKLLDGANGTTYAVTLSCTGRDGQNGSVTFGTLGNLTKNDDEKTVDLTGNSHGKMKITASCTNAADGAVDGEVVGLSVEEVTFDVGAQGSFHPVQKDKVDQLGKPVPYDTPHWKRDRTIQSPVCYTRKSKVRLTVKFVAGNGVNGNVTVKGEGDGLAFAAKQGAIVNGAVTLTNWDAQGNLNDEVDFFDPMTIKWEYSTDGGQTWKSAGSSENQVYVTLETPQVKVYHTLVHIGCKAAEGESKAGKVIGKIWEEFSDRYVQRVDGIVLTYYKEKKPAGGTDTKGLLEHGDGRCGAWASFMVDMCKTQKVTVSHKGVIARNQIERAPMGGFTVKNMKWGPIRWPGDTYPYVFAQRKNRRGLPGQGVATPESKSFIDHAVATNGNVVYDPSYGKKYESKNLADSLKAWEEASVFSFGTGIFVNPSPRSRPNTAAAETRFK